jgi:hypothetical protein
MTEKEGRKKSLSLVMTQDVFPEAMGTPCPPRVGLRWIETESELPLAARSEEGSRPDPVKLLL